MRTDVTNDLNTNLETHAIYLEQNAAYYEAMAARCRAAARVSRELASPEVQADDPQIDGLKFKMPAIFNPNDPVIKANVERQRAEAALKATRGAGAEQAA